jgi:hypothetical protein
VPGAVLDITAIINSPPLTLLPGVQRDLFFTIPVITAPTIPPPPYERELNTTFYNATAGFTVINLPNWFYAPSYPSFLVGPPAPSPPFPPVVTAGFPPDIFGPRSEGVADPVIPGVHVNDYTVDHGTLAIRYLPGPDN